MPARRTVSVLLVVLIVLFAALGLDLAPGREHVGTRWARELVGGRHGAVRIPHRVHHPGLLSLSTLEEVPHLGSRRQYVTPQHFAVIHLGLGDRDRAFVWLEKAYEDRAFEVT